MIGLVKAVVGVGILIEARLRVHDINGLVVHFGDWFG